MADVPEPRILFVAFVKATIVAGKVARIILAISIEGRKFKTSDRTVLKT